MTSRSLPANLFVVLNDFLAEIDGEQRNNSSLPVLPMLLHQVVCDTKIRQDLVYTSNHFFIFFLDSGAFGFSPL